MTSEARDNLCIGRGAQESVLLIKGNQRWLKAEAKNFPPEDFPLNYSRLIKGIAASNGAATK
jgi:hypothetical protein